MKSVLSGLLLLALAGLLGADTHSGPSWLLGCWQSDDGSEVEAWAEEPDGSMIGFAISLSQGRLAFYELLSIRRTGDGTLIYTAHPAGQSRTVFTAVAPPAGGVLFANPEHDYPQEIGYRREGGRMIATISAQGGENPRSFDKRRCD